jgi:alkanesulfonate monooxygenase
MSTSDKPLDFLWFIPTSGDGSYLGSDDLSRPADPGYFREIAQAADRLGYSGVLIPTGVACEESFILAANSCALPPTTMLRSSRPWETRSSVEASRA